jgi:hypothetical protein
MSTSSLRQASAAAPAPDATSFTSARFLAHHLESVQYRCADDDGSAMLIVVKDGNLHTGAQRALDDEAFRRLDVLEVDAAERGLEARDDVDELVGIPLVYLDIEDIDAGELLEEHGLAFHHRLRRQRPIGPSPSTAVPLVITATRLPRAVRLRASPGSATIASHAIATPGVYASARSDWLTRLLVALTAIFPGTGNR